ncbi:MAG: HAMP domain-containing protein, partial [Hyphomicrobiaceae bacterium]|nr:HAMP domain-containing protein [Hyphomicrobiaceae bacterium]
MTSASDIEAQETVAPRHVDVARRTEVPRSHRIIRTVGIFLTTIAVLVSIGSFWIMTGASNIEPTPEVWTIIWIVNAVLVLFVVALIITEGLLLFRAWRRRLVGSRLRSRLVILFALVAAIPGLIVAAFAAFTLNQGLDQWFSDRTRQIVESSRLIARAYLQEHGQVLRDDVIWVATELEAAHDTFTTDRTRFQRILTALATTRSLPYTSLVAGDGDLLMRAEINVQGRRPTAPASLLPDVQEGVPTLLSPGNTNLVGALIKLRGYDNVYLFAARTVDPEVLEYVKLTEENISDYRTYESNRLVFQLTFGLMYAGLAVILVLAAVWLGMAMANRFVDPIRNLMVASNRVSKGQLDTRVPSEGGGGDLHDLSVRFNQMVAQLESQRQALVDANDNAEKRRQFTEAVVEGVSAGVIGLDPDGAITLANRRAGEMFHRGEIDLIDQKIAEIAPQLEPLMTRAQSSRTGQLRDQIELAHGSEVRTYQVQLTREGTLTESKGYVVTLDDITDLVSAQRTSAWADVARRIAHEIK